jgi:hypothetical protein
MFVFLSSNTEDSSLMDTQAALNLELRHLLSQWSDVDQHEPSEVQQDENWEISQFVSLQPPWAEEKVSPASDSPWKEVRAMATSCNSLHGNPTPVASPLPPTPLSGLLFAPT